MKIWILLTVVYALFTGFFEFSKKKALDKNTIYEILAVFSLISFLFACVSAENVFSISSYSLIIILIKSIIVLLAWIFGLYAIDKMPISLYGIIRISRVIFSILMSIFILGETINFITIIGMFIVILGLILVNDVSEKKEKRETSIKVIIIMLVSCLLNSISAIIDKKILEDITSSQLQFWFILFLTIGYWMILFIKKEKINLKDLKRNYWILFAALCFFLGDRCLFMANEIPESQVSVMTILKQISTIELIVIGKIAFKEKNITKKILCCILIIFGIALTII